MGMHTCIYGERLCSRGNSTVCTKHIDSGSSDIVINYMRHYILIILFFLSLRVQPSDQP